MIDLIAIFLHLDQYLASIIGEYGLLVYAILFVIIFLETGFVVTPFFPGDSLIFVAGALAAAGMMDVSLLFILLAVAAILGDTANYWIGRHFGQRIIEKKKIKFVKQEYIDKANSFYAKHGKKTIVIARFIPFIRTFAPFVAGIVKMDYGHFIAYNIIGGVAWVASFLTLGYFFGNIDIVKSNLSLVIIGIIVISLLPAAVGYAKHRIKK
jgi:membrane-associated protein